MVKTAPTADLSVTVGQLESSVLQGTELNYEVTVRNNGPEDATGILLSATLPSGLSLVSANPIQVSCSETNDLIDCLLEDLLVGASIIFTIQLAVDDLAKGTMSSTFTLLGSQRRGPSERPPRV